MRDDANIRIMVLGTRGFPGIQGGVEMHCQELYPLLAEAGCTITVFTRKKYLPRGYSSVWQGVTFIDLWSSRRSWLESISHSLLAAAYCLKTRPDIVHVHNIGPALIIPLLKLFRIKTVLTYHSQNYLHDKWGPFARKFLFLGEQSGIRFANGIICVSRNLKEELRMEYSRDDIIHIPNGVRSIGDGYDDSILDELNIRGKTYIYTVCRLVPEKGLDTLLEAYQNLGRPDIPLVISGDADIETSYSKTFKDRVKKTKGAILAGFNSGNRLVSLYSHASFFVLPSFQEGSSLALLEALSYGLTVIVSDIPANRELIDDEQSLFVPGNPASLLSKMKNALVSSDTSEARNQKKARIRQDYNWHDSAKRTLELYEHVLRD